MPKVHILKPEVISKIAAGEVIERPASVLKELVENALDAQADTIEIEIEDAGKSAITVKDNGHGIDKDDLKTIFLRHATSKISNTDDLYNIHSLGFRGEALYSIAAIAHVTVHSKTEDQDTGWSIHLRGGEVFHTRPCPFNNTGTEIAIKELFFNTPARKKFLKSDTTEVHQILNTLIPYTFLHHDVRFLLNHGKKELIHAAPTSNRVSRMASILNLDEHHLIDAQHNFEHQNIAVELILGDINIKRTRRDMQFIFVNNRPVFNKAIAFHMNQVYRLILPPDLYPCFAVYITVPAHNVDVNIHPTKREVKIKNEQDICSVLRSMCEQALMSSGHMKEVTGPKSSTPESHLIRRALSGSDQGGRPFDADSPETHPDLPRETGTYAFPKDAWNQLNAPPLTQQEFLVTEDMPGSLKTSNMHTRLHQARYVGIVINKFLLFETDRALLVIDQHAAAERITYERLIRQMDKGTVEVQQLLSPELIKSTPQELLVWEEVRGKFETLGFSSSQWDEETIAVHTYPIFIRDIAKAVRHLLAGDNLAKGDHDAWARRACRSSVMAGDKLTPEQAQHIRDELIKCLDPFTCPHGRPTVIEMPEAFLDKQFLRT